MLLIDYLKARGIEVPHKKEIFQSIHGALDNTKNIGYNECHDAFASIYMPDDVNKPIHSCKCIAEGVRTVRKIDEYLCQCPRCGGIIVRNNTIPSVKYIQRILDQNTYGNQAQAIHSLLTEDK